MKITIGMVLAGTVFHCSTEEQADELCEKLDDLGYIWRCDCRYFNNTHFLDIGEGTYYDVRRGTCFHKYLYGPRYDGKIRKVIEYEMDKKKWSISKLLEKIFKH